jgi:hypothetical protein
MILLTISETIGGRGSSFGVEYIGIGGGGGINPYTFSINLGPPLILRTTSSNSF